MRRKGTLTASSRASSILLSFMSTLERAEYSSAAHVAYSITCRHPPARPPARHPGGSSPRPRRQDSSAAALASHRKLPHIPEPLTPNP